MKRIKFLYGIFCTSALLISVSCAKDMTEEVVSSKNDNTPSSKLISTSTNAVEGQLLVYFDDEAIESIESSVTRSGNTRTGINKFDNILDRIGVKSIQRLFPVTAKHEERTRQAGLHKWYIVSFDESVDLDKAAADMAEISEVSYVQFNTRLSLIDGNQSAREQEAVPLSGSGDEQFNDPGLVYQWHYINNGNTEIYSKIKAGADVNCKEAWKLCTGDPRIVVAIVDDAVKYDHPDLAANMWTNEAEINGSDNSDDDGNGYSDDKYGYNFVLNTGKFDLHANFDASHGTHVAGTVSAVNNNGEGGCGIAGGSGNNDGVKLMSCQIFRYNPATGKTEGGSVDVVSRAIKYAADNGASIIQCSFGITAGNVTSDSSYSTVYSAEKQAVDYFASTSNCEALEGGLTIFAAGNDMIGMSGYPGAYTDFISVTAMSCDYTPAYYTNYGPACNIAAPGGDECQSLLETAYRSSMSAVYSTLTNGRYGYMQGTSMACPHVSGVAALGLSYALQLGKKFTRKEFYTMLLTSVNDIDQYCTGTKQYINNLGSVSTLNLSQYKGQMGTGYLDAFRMLMNIRGITCIPIVPKNDIQTFDVQPYLSNSDTELKISKVEISKEDMEKLGITQNITIFNNKMLIKCTKTGSAIIKITFTAGTNSNSGMNGMSVTKEFALVSRNSHANNGGWL